MRTVGRSQSIGQRLSLPLFCVVLSALCCACGSLPTLSQDDGSEVEIVAATSLTTPEGSTSTATPLAPSQTEAAPPSDVVEAGGVDVIAGMDDSAMDDSAMDDSAISDSAMGGNGATAGDEEPLESPTTTATSVVETSQATSTQATSSPPSSASSVTSSPVSSTSSTSSSTATSATAPPTTATTTTASSTSSGQNNFPDGTIVQLSNEQSGSFKAQLGGGSQPVLVWFWLPG